MRSTRQSLLVTILSFLLTPFAAAQSVPTDDDDAEDYDVTARVVRVSLVNGEVNLKRSGDSDWERARLNSPLVEGDTVSTEKDSRLEIQVDARNFVRLEANSVLTIVTLRNEGVALSVLEGTASVRLAKFDRDHEYFEVDAPRVTIALEKTGLYRIDAPREGRLRLTARDGGRGRIYSATSGFALRNGRSAELIVDESNEGDWELLTAASNDPFDDWVDDRERYLAQRQRSDDKYYDNYIWGAEELDEYGNWAYVQEYGWIWRPHVTIINIYPNWAPYRHGYWTWCQPYGWTWVGYEPWGWAPYHYGRWVYYDNYWAWCPRSYYYKKRSWWRPALVAFHFSFGSHVSWYPLSYHHRDPRSRHYGNQDRLTPLRREELANLRRVNPAYLRAVTSVSTRDFGADGGKFRVEDESVARRVITGEPLRGDLPIRPAGAVGRRTTSGEQNERLTIARPARVAPTVELPSRSTGAAVRTPGVALDEELRRSRVFNGREPRPQIPMENSGSAGRATDSRPTGAVMRPARPQSVPLNSVDENNRRREESDNSRERASRPNQANPRRDFPETPDTNHPPAAERRPPSVPSQSSPADNAAPTENADRSERKERPERVEPRSDLPTRVQPHRNEENADRPVDRPQRHERTEAPRRSESPNRREAPPSYEPPPQRSEPARHDPPPQRSEPVRHDPPPRSDPAPQRSEPAPQRSDPAPQRSEPAPQRSDPPSHRSEPATPERDRPPRAKAEPLR